MFAFLICALTLNIHRVQSACEVDDSICTERPEVQQQIVDVHNQYRRTVTPPASDMLRMSYNEKFAGTVAAWLENCDLRHGPYTTRTIDGYELGENLFYSNNILSWDECVGAWHSEVQNYQFPVGPIKEGLAVGHYTQLVWDGTYEVGCAVKLCADKGVYFYGCHYYRAGNFRGVPPYKEGLPCASCPDNCDDKLCTNPCPFVDLHKSCPEWYVKQKGCFGKAMEDWCEGTCKCRTEVIPIG